ncbi:MAG: polyprenyl synthetase family protein [Fermentimonas sp.]|jgi:octaprenyl-diphosphate synthase
MDHNGIINELLKDELKIFEEYLMDSVKTDNPRISEMIQYVFKSNGKRLRPILVLMTAKAVGNITKETYHGATTVELLHTATLVHDDVVDNSDMRRGQSSVNFVYDNTKAVLLGDYLLSSSLAESVKTNNLKIIDLVSKLGKQLAEGELEQYILSNKAIIDEDAYFMVINKKTSLLIQSSMMIGALTAGANDQQLEKFRQLGEKLGIGFQIRDDIFDYFNDDVGKPTGNDIREGKITLPLIYALNNAPQSAAVEMKQIISNRDYTPENVEALIKFAKDYKGIYYANSKIEQLMCEAEVMIKDFDISDDIKDALTFLLSYMKNRTY